MIASEQATCFQKDFVYIHDMVFFSDFKIKLNYTYRHSYVLYPNFTLKLFG